MMQMLQSCHFHDGALRRQTSRQPDDAARRRQRIGHGPHDRLIAVEFHVAQILGNSLAGNGHTSAMQITAVEQRAHQHRHTASFPDVFRHVTAARFEIGEIRRAFEDRRHIKEVEGDPRFMRHCRQMQRRIG